jgi:hypothetical protein
MVKAAFSPSFPRSWLDCSGAAPSKRTTSCDARSWSELANKGVGLFPNRAM